MPRFEMIFSWLCGFLKFEGYNAGAVVLPRNPPGEAAGLVPVCCVHGNSFVAVDIKIEALVIDDQNVLVHVLCVFFGL
jgi:hypothetical protein